MMIRLFVSHFVIKIEAKIFPMGRHKVSKENGATDKI
jgi:hypothetical protein